MAPTTIIDNKVENPRPSQPSVDMAENSASTDRPPPFVLNEVFFRSEQELEDVAAGLGFAGESYGEVVKRIAGLQNKALENLDDQQKAYSQHRNTSIGEIREALASERDQARSATQRVRELEKEQSELRERRQVTQTTIRLIYQELRQERLRQEKEFFHQEAQRLATDEYRKATIEDVRGRYSFAEEIYALKRKHWQNNKPEYDRIADEFRIENDRINDQLKTVHARLNRFQQFGVTRTTSGFLVYAGYASFAGAGGLIASLIHNRQGSTGDFLSRIIDGFRTLLGISSGGTALWRPMANLTGLLFASLLIITAVTLAMNRLIRILYPNWAAASGRRKSRGETNPFAFVSTLRQRLTSLFRQESSTSERGPARSEKNANNSSQISHRSFVQLLAHLPYVVAASLLFFFFAALGLGNTNLTGSSPASLEVSSTYIGFVFILLSTSASILYVTHVIEPRWQRHELRSAPEDSVVPKAKTPHTLRLAWEFVVLAALLALSLAMTAFLSNSPTQNQWALGAVAIFMCLASLGLAYGLVQRGLFKDTEFLDSKRQWYRAKIDYYQGAPTVDDVLEGLSLADIGDGLRANRMTRHKLDELKMLYELNKIFADDFDDDKKLQSFLGQFLEGDVSLDGLKAAKQDSEILTGNYAFGPEKLQSIYVRSQELGITDARVEEITSQLQKLSAEIKDSEARVKDLDQQLSGQELELISLASRYARNRAEVEARNERTLMKFRAAFSLGTFAHKILSDEDVVIGV